ncbi:MAG: hypothetical protein JEZ07_20095 [Phycisphaerae bacterium]|nr:hypothetical protein [Phycisphaerae bacterium]
MESCKTRKISKSYLLKLAELFLPAILLILFITMSGCNICSNSNKTSSRPYLRIEGYPNTSGMVQSESVNPYMIFGSPNQVASSTYSNAENYYRLPWPSSQYAKQYVSSDEVVTYREENFSDQWSNYNNRPRDNFHRRSRTYRSGYMIRK